jgi:hypothetical protein
MKRFLLPTLGAVALFAAPALQAQNFQWHDIPHVTVEKPEDLRAAAVQSMASRLEMRRFKNMGIFRFRHSAYYYDRAGYFQGATPHYYWFFFSDPPADDSGFPTRANPEGDLRYGVYSSLRTRDLFLENGMKCSAMEKFLLSAYRQEIDPMYRDTLTAPVKYVPKDMAVFNRRNWISSGYATAYAYQDNPFYDPGILSIAGGYAMDALTVAIMVTGAVSGKTTGDKIGFVATGAVLNLAWKWLSWGPMHRSPIRTYNNVLKSGYKVPSFEVEWLPENSNPWK